MFEWVLVDERFEAVNRMAPLVKFLQNVEVMIEMLLSQYGTQSGKWKTILVIELIKFLVKMYAIVKSKCKVALDYSVLPTDFQLEFENRQSTEYAERMAKGEIPSAMDINVTYQQQQNQQQQHHHQRFNIGKRTGHKLPRMIPLSNQQQQQQNRGRSPKPTLLLSNYEARETMKRQRYIALLAGEITHAIRPVIYVILLMRYNLKSWKPWLVSLLIDITSRYLTSYAQKDHIDTNDIAPWEKNTNALTIQDEFRRRMSLWFYYLLRSPLFDKIIAPVVRGLSNRVSRIPLISSLVVNILEYLLALQSYYFYTAAS